MACCADKVVGTLLKVGVLWGTGFVGKMVIAEVVKHPLFELMGASVSSAGKVGCDVIDICFLAAPVGIIATKDVDALIALKTNALVRHGPFTMMLMGLYSEVCRFRSFDLLDYANYEGGYETERGIGHEPEFTQFLENCNVLIFVWGVIVSRITHIAGIVLDEITIVWDKWVTRTECTTAKDVIKPGHVAAARCTM